MDRMRADARFGGFCHSEPYYTRRLWSCPHNRDKWVGGAEVSLARGKSEFTQMADLVRPPMRWAQLTLVRRPGAVRVRFWLDYFKEIKADAAS